MSEVTERKLSWSQPQCEACWIHLNATEGPQGIEGVRRPTVLLMEHTQLEMCAWCGHPTIMGIYVRVDPSTVPYPRTEEDDG